MSRINTDLVDDIVLETPRNLDRFLLAEGI